MSTPDENTQQQSGPGTEPVAEQGQDNLEAGAKESGDDRKSGAQPNLAAKQAESPVPDSTKADTSRSAICGVCNEKPGRYKCPRCRMPYCSVACNKTHKENHPPDPPPSAPAAPPAPNDAKKPKPAPSHPFSALDSSEKLQTLFKKYPRLPDQLLQIHEATQPPSSSSTTTPFYAKPSESRRLEKQMWDRSTGIRNGKEALRRARAAAGEDGEAVREYEELVLHLLSSGGEGIGSVGRTLEERDEELLRNFVAAETRRPEPED